jgi:hypothetical protein
LFSPGTCARSFSGNCRETASSLFFNKHRSAFFHP